MARRVSDPLTRFWAHVAKTETCWLWTGAQYSNGYGAFGVRSVDGCWRNALAHRFAYEAEYGAMAYGLHVCHRCDTPLCVRPDHLFLGTQKDNMRDCVAKGRFKSTGRGTGSKLTEAAVRAIRATPKAYGAVVGLARRFGVSKGTIIAVRNGEAWSWVGM
jgi:hypothetical protein